MKTTDYRRDFPLLMQETAAYLDNAATAQRPQCVLDAEKTFYETQNANPLRGLYPLSIAATEAVEEARLAVRDFLQDGALMVALHDLPARDLAPALEFFWAQDAASTRTALSHTPSQLASCVVSA